LEVYVASKKVLSGGEYVEQRREFEMLQDVTFWENIDVN
jgi:hypothetical protein